MLYFLFLDVAAGLSLCFKQKLRGAGASVFNLFVQMRFCKVEGYIFEFFYGGFVVRITA